MPLSLVMQGVSKNFTMIFQMLLCGECYENVYKITIIQHLAPWIIYTPLSANVFVTLATQQHLEYHCKSFLKYPVMPKQLIDRHCGMPLIILVA
jgi:hypothetical protein